MAFGRIAIIFLRSYIYCVSLNQYKTIRIFVKLFNTSLQLLYYFFFNFLIIIITRKHECYENVSVNSFTLEVFTN